MIEKPDPARLTQTLDRLLRITWIASAILAAAVAAAQNARSEITVPIAEWIPCIAAAVFVWIPITIYRRPIGRIAGLLWAVAFLGMALKLTDPRLAVIVFTGGCVLAIRTLNHPGLMTAVGTIIAVSIGVFAFELPLLIPAKKTIEWGEPASFAYLFPDAPPLIGPGGRLRPNLDARMVHPEKRNGVRLITNAAGFRNASEFPIGKLANEIRVLNLGDSFSIGYRIDQADFLGTVIKDKLNHPLSEKEVSVLNAEVSDPATGLYYLQRFGLAYSPDVVLYGLSANDVMQAYSFVGPGREFALAGGRIAWTRPPDAPRVDIRADWPNVVYPYPCTTLAETKSPTATSTFQKLAIVRQLSQWRRQRLLLGEVTASWLADDRFPTGHAPLIDGFPNLGFYHRDSKAVVAPMYETTFAVLSSMRDQSAAAGSRLVIVIHPQRFTVQPRDWAALRAAWCLREEDFDLKAMSRRVRDGCEAAGVDCVDLTDAFEAAAGGEQLYLPAGDVHYNDAGHRLAAETIARLLADGGFLK